MADAESAAACPPPLMTEGMAHAFAIVVNLRFVSLWFWLVAALALVWWIAAAHLAACSSLRHSLSHTSWLSRSREYHILMNT